MTTTQKRTTKRDPNKPVGIFLVPYIRDSKLLWKVRATYRGPAVKDVATGFKSAEAAKKWYTKWVCGREDKAADPLDSRRRFLRDIAKIPGVTVRTY